MRVYEFRVFDPKNGECIKDLAGRVSRRNVTDANELINLVAEYLGWTGASSNDVEHTVNGLILTKTYPGGNAYRIRATD